MRSSRLSRLILCGLALCALASADESLDPRREQAIDVDSPAPPVAPYENKDIKRTRAYPEQPPTIPHSIAGYEISLRGNKCLSCHSRTRAAVTGAPMVGVSHFRGRDLQTRSDVSPARYFCTQCHVPQASTPLTVENDFIDAADLPQE